MDVKSSILNYLPEKISKEIMRAEPTNGLQEIRLRVNKPITLTVNGNPKIIESSAKVTKSDIDEIINRACCYSVYSFEKEIANGYITVQGGHRIGFCGTAVTNGDQVTSVKDISAVNFRIAREIFGSAKEICEKLFDKRVESTLIVGPPNCGKTTMLRDIARALSENMKICIIDERNEISATFLGVPQNDIGKNTDVFCDYPKAFGIMTAIRTMSPDLIICDEIGGKEEADKLGECLNAGVKIICTAHAGTISELKNRTHIESLIEKNVFKNIVLLDSKLGRIKEIVKSKECIDEDFRTDNSRPVRKCSWSYSV